MMKLFKTLLLGVTIMAAGGCATSLDGEDYENVTPAFSIMSFFDGNVKAWGIVQNRSGEVVQRFKVDINGRVENNVLTMDEQFDYGVGEGPASRTWTITPLENNRFRGEANDIDGPAQGQHHGNAFHFSYEMDLPVDDTTYHVAFDDWFWAFDDKTIMNRSYIKKFGLVMAEITIFMQKQP